MLKLVCQWIASIVIIGQQLVGWLSQGCLPNYLPLPPPSPRLFRLKQVFEYAIFNATRSNKQPSELWEGWKAVSKD